MRRGKNSTVSSYKIMVVDDEIGVIDSLSVVLRRSGYIINGSTNPVDAVEQMRNEHFDMLILDYLMMPIHGDRVVELIREFDNDIYILLLTGYKDLAPPLKTIRSLDIQGYCEKSDHFDQLMLMVESGIKSVAQMHTIKQFNAELGNTNKMLEKHYMELVEVLRILVDAKDVYTRGHSDRVSYFASKIGEKLCLDDNDMETLRIGSLFHDIGKINTPDSILKKKEALNPEEFEEIKRHPIKGADMLSLVSIFTEIIPLIKHHHERIDGRGYPDGLKADEIPFLAKIVSVADAFDAMMSDRTYRSRLSIDESIERLKAGMGTQFETSIVLTFVDLTSDFDRMLAEIDEKIAIDQA